MPVEGPRNVAFLERGREDIERYFGKWLSQFEPFCRRAASKFFGIQSNEARSDPLLDRKLYRVQPAGEEMVRVRYPD